jgi:probable H4MPT-linked C1 transfer pathway protein
MLVLYPGAEGLAGAAPAAYLRSYYLMLQLTESAFQKGWFSILLLGSHDLDLQKMEASYSSPDLKLLWFRIPRKSAMILGLDIGGANTKAANSKGTFAQSVYLPLWQSATLSDALQSWAELDPEAVAVVMTGELADCFPSKLAGVQSLISEVKRAFRCPISFWGTEGFQWKDLRDLAGANWSASATFLCREMGDGIFADMGSTTTDLIPMVGRPLAGKTDFQRLARGELVYTGLLRTSLVSLLPAAKIRGESIPVSAELFAIAADAYLALGDISEDGYSCPTPDGRGRSQKDALNRLARSVCSDLEEIGEEAALAIAAQARARQLQMLASAFHRLAAKHGLARAMAAGVGEMVVARAAGLAGLHCSRLSQTYGREISNVFPAYAVARLLESDLGAGGFRNGRR